MVRITIPPDPRQSKQTHGGSNRYEACPFTVLHDHRERVGGWRFQGLRADSKKKYRPLLVQSREIHMTTADYTAELPDGTQLPVLIERKSGDDMLGSISGGHQRLRKEHERMLALVEQGWTCCLICEASLSDLVAEMESPQWCRAATPELLLGCAASWPVKFKVPWLFGGSREVAERLALKTLWRAWDVWMKEQKAAAASAADVVKFERSLF